MKRLLLAPNVRTPLRLRDRAILELCYATGLRLGDPMDLTVTDIDPTAGDLVVMRGKGRRARQVPVGAAAWVWVRRYLTEVRPQLVRRRGEATLFVRRRGRRLDPTDVLMIELGARGAGARG
jgi:integrase/recombinase XerD